MCASSLDPSFKSEGTVKHHVLLISVTVMSRREQRKLGKKGRDSWYCGREVW